MACDRLPEDEVQTSASVPSRAGFRFREDAEVAEELFDDSAEVVEEPISPPARRFRFTVEEPGLAETQTRDTASVDAPTGSPTSTDSGFRFVPPDEPAVDEAPVPSWAIEEESAEVQAEWPDVDRREQERRETDRRQFDNTGAPYVSTDFDDRLDGYVAPAVFDQESITMPADFVEDDNDSDPWQLFRDAFTADEEVAAPASVNDVVEEPESLVEADADDPWEAFRFAQQDVPVSVDEIPPTFAEPIYEEPVFAQPISEKLDVPEFEVESFEPEVIDTHDSVLDEVMRHDENAIDDDESGERLAPFLTSWGDDAAISDVEVPGAFEENSVPHDNDWSQWDETATPQELVASDNAWGNDDVNDVWSTDAIANAHEDWSTVPQEWTAGDAGWPTFETQQDDVVEVEQSWSGGEDVWPVVDDAMWNETPVVESWDDVSQQPVVQDDVWPVVESDTWPDVRSDEGQWSSVAASQDVVGETWPADVDPWNAASDEYAQPDAGNEATFYVQDEYGTTYENDQVDGATSHEDEQPWWAEQSAFSGDSAHQGEATLPYFDELDAEDTEDAYAFDEPAFNGAVSDLFDEGADLDEPDPFELADDDWSLPDETGRGGRSARQLDREPQKSRSDNGVRKASKGKGSAKKSNAGRKSAKSGGFHLPFASSSTVVTVVVIALAIVALSLLFKDAFQRVGAAPNPETAAAASCADAPETVGTKKLDMQAAILGSVDGATTIVDHQAGTGTVDFTRALAAEPDASAALNILDQSRFGRGYDRKFSVKKGGTIHLSIYEFKGAICAQQYLQLHSSPANAQIFTVADVKNAAGEVMQTGKVFSASARGSIDDWVVLVQWTDAPLPDLATSTLQSIMSKQVAALRTAGV